MKVTTEIKPSRSRCDCWTWGVCVDGVKLYSGEVYGDRAKAAAQVASVVAELDRPQPLSTDPLISANL
jgi:hypothetical protein